MAEDDDSGGFFSSLVTFNVTKGVNYQVAVDGYNGATGDVVLGLPSGTGYQGLSEDDGSPTQITQQPASQIVTAGATVTLTVVATNAATYQWWYLQNQPIPGANDSSLTVTNIQEDSVGGYHVLVANSAGSAVSDVATVSI